MIIVKRDKFSIAYRLVRFLFFLLYFPFVKKVNGIQNLPREGAFIVASNHASIIDGFLVGIYITRISNRHLHVLTVRAGWAYTNPIFRYIIELMQSIWIEPKERARALITTIEYLKSGKLVGIFPEAYRSRDGRIQKGERGIALPALNAKVPVVPLGLVNTYNIMPRGRIIPRPQRCEINIGAPLEFKEFYNEYDKAIVQRDQAKIAEIEEKVVRIIMKEIARLSNQEYPY